MPADARWRGLGIIPGSGLAFRDAYAAFDAVRKFSVPEFHSEDIKGCCCGDILRGIIEPPDAHSLKKSAHRRTPQGPAWFHRKAPVPHIIIICKKKGISI